MISRRPTFWSQQGGFLVGDLFDQRNWNELKCFRESWLYQIIRINPRVPRPAANQIPVMGCRDGAACLTPDELFVGCALSDNQLDMDCENHRLINEPHVMTTFPKIWDSYRLVLGPHAYSHLERSLRRAPASTPLHTGERLSATHSGHNSSSLRGPSHKAPMAPRLVLVAVEATVCSTLRWEYSFQVRYQLAASVRLRPRYWNCGSVLWTANSVA